MATQIKPEKPRPNFVLRKQISYLVTGVSLIPEFFQIGYYHEMFRATTYYNNNVNSPVVGNPIIILLSIFYLGRLVGGLISLSYCRKRKFVQIIYWMAIPMIVSMIVCTWSRGMVLQIVCAAVNGFCSGFGPATCILRSEEDIVQMEYQKIEHQNNGGDMSDQKAYSYKSQVPEMFVGIFTLLFSYGMMYLSGLVYKDSTLSQGWSAWLMAFIATGIFAVFFLFYGCQEPDYFRDDSPKR